MPQELSLNDEILTEAEPILTKELMDKQAQIANETVKNIEQSVKLNEEDKKKIEENKKKPGRPKSINNNVQVAQTPKEKNEKIENDQVLDLQEALNKFILDKTDISNNDGGIIERLPTSIDLLDAILGGGLGVGTFSLLVGCPGTFKSALLCQIIAATQKKYLKKCTATYHDSESAMSMERISKLGVNNPKIKPYDDVTVESIFKTIEATSAFKQLNNILDYPSIIAWDSIANTSTEKERTTDNINETIGLRARLMSALFPRYLPKMKENKISLIAVNQLREKMAMGQFAPAADLKYMGDKEIPGGQAIKFNAFHLVLLKNLGDIKYDQYGFNGILLEAKCIKNKFFAPNIPIRMIVDFNTGISNFWTNYNFLVDKKKMESGAWNYLVAMPELKFRTKDALENYNTNQKFKDLFNKEVKDTIKIEILDKYQ